MRRVIQSFLCCLSVAVASGCATDIPQGLEPVTGFEVNRYLGTWYEIARLDHGFERGLSNVTAEYSFRDEDTLNVVNRGYDDSADEWEEARGRAEFQGDPAVASLKVSFFGPFYGGYHVIVLDKDGYEYAMVSGPNRDFLWILAREPVIDDTLLDELVEQARQWDFPVEDLIYVDQSMNAEPEGASES